MHSLIHIENAHATAAERGRRATGRPARPPRPEPPPLRRHAARAVAHVAIRLDRETARRAVA
jgi:hypothetical protein